VDVVEVDARVDGVLGLVGERAAQVERERRLPDDLVEALRRTGVNRLLLPEALGGVPAPLSAMLDVAEQIAAVDGSTGWAALIGFGSNVFAGYMPEAGARTVFADPDQPSATMFASAGRVTFDGQRYRLTGRWPFVSNCLHSAWAGLGAFVELVGSDGNGDEPVEKIVFVPVDDLVVEDTWDSAGLRGTGSHHVTATDVPVELDHMCAFTDTPWPDGPRWRLPLGTVMVPLLAAVPLGIARGALDEIARQAREGRSARRGQVTDDPVALGELAEADATLWAARSGLHAAVDEARRRVEAGQAVERPLQARIVLAGMHACDAAVAATSVAHRLGGGAAAYAGSRLLRALCDVEAARQHLLFAHAHRPALAQIRSGIDMPYRNLVR
jgi:alkylation response protein AidB-like acyl-CoA dehydrogenase